MTVSSVLRVTCCGCPLCDCTVNGSGHFVWLAFTVTTARNCASFLNVCLSGLAIDFVSVCLYYSGSSVVYNLQHKHLNSPHPLAALSSTLTIRLSLAPSLFLIKPVKSVSFYLSVLFSMLILLSCLFSLREIISTDLAKPLKEYIFFFLPCFSVMHTWSEAFWQLYEFS